MLMLLLLLVPRASKARRSIAVEPELQSEGGACSGIVPLPILHSFAIETQRCVCVFFFGKLGGCCGINRLLFVAEKLYVCQMVLDGDMLWNLMRRQCSVAAVILRSIAFALTFEVWIGIGNSRETSRCHC